MITSAVLTLYSIVLLNTYCIVLWLCITVKNRIRREDFSAFYETLVGLDLLPWKWDLPWLAYKTQNKNRIFISAYKSPPPSSHHISSLTDPTVLSRWDGKILDNQVSSALRRHPGPTAVHCEFLSLKQRSRAVRALWRSRLTSSSKNWVGAGNIFPDRFSEEPSEEDSASSDVPCLRQSLLFTISLFTIGQKEQAVEGHGSFLSAECKRSPWRRS